MRKLVLVVIAAALLLAACGGSKSNNSSGSKSNTGAGSNTNSGGTDDFSKALANASKANIKITYTGSDGKPVTIAQDGTGKSLYMSNGSIFINDGTNTFSCDGAGPDQKCTQLPAAAGAAGNIGAAFLTSLSGLTHLNSSVYNGHVSPETIAGRDARCVTFKASDYAGLAALGNNKGYDPNAQATICVDKDTGFLLRLESKSSTEDSHVFEATQVQTASDSDFKPPVTPETVPSNIPGYNP